MRTYTVTSLPDVCYFGTVDLQSSLELGFDQSGKVTEVDVTSVRDLGLEAVTDSKRHKSKVREFTVKVV